MLITNLKVENMTDPVNLDVQAPALSWKLIPANGEFAQPQPEILAGNGGQQPGIAEGKMSLIYGTAELWTHPM